MGVGTLQVAVSPFNDNGDIRSAGSGRRRAVACTVGTSWNAILLPSRMITGGERGDGEEPSSFGRVLLWRGSGAAGAGGSMSWELGADHQTVQQRSCTGKVHSRFHFGRRRLP